MKTKLLRYLGFHFVQVLLCAPSPYKGVSAGPAFQLGPIDKHALVIHFTQLVQFSYKLVEQVLYDPTAPARAESSQGAVVRSFSILQKPHEIDLVPAGLLQLSAGIDYSGRIRRYAGFKLCSAFLLE